ncbi:MAG TPA: hypothetical protein VMH06_03380, partial [Thermodesulfovibrionales bacterium]|nr:hypothetical protein [Thermodesulfovibrionales bacterium]
LSADGTFQKTCMRGKTVLCNVTGTWIVRENHLIWIYDADHYEFKKGQEDNTMILDFEAHDFLLKEMNDAIATFKRAK